MDVGSSKSSDGLEEFLSSHWGRQTIEDFLVSIKAGDNEIQTRRKDLQDPLFKTRQDRVQSCRRRATSMSGTVGALLGGIVAWSAESPSH